MFDPTVFDNVKVVFEGALYDLDAEAAIRIKKRQDLVDLAAMSRLFAMQFELPDGRGTSELRLSSDLTDFASELTGLRLVSPEHMNPGAHISFLFRVPLSDTCTPDARLLYQSLTGRWRCDVTAEQTLESRSVFDGSNFLTTESYVASVALPKKTDDINMDGTHGLILVAAATLRELEHLLEL